MGEFKDKISKLSNSEMEEIWKKITSYQGSYIDDFLTELNVRGIRDQFYLNDYTLEDLFAKVKNSENIEFLKSLIEKRGITSSISNTEKKKVNYAIPTAGIAILIVVIIKLLARNVGNEHKEQRQNYQTETEQLQTKYEENKENKEESYKRISEDISNKLFEPGGQLRVELDEIKVSIQEKKKAGFEFDKAGSEGFINATYTSMKERYFNHMDSILYQSYSKGLPQEIKDKIAAQYLNELRQIIK